MKKTTYPKYYNYADREQRLLEFKQSVLCAIRERKIGKSFSEVARVCKLPDRQVAFKLYNENKRNNNLTDESMI